MARPDDDSPRPEPSPDLNALPPSPEPTALRSAVDSVLLALCILTILALGLGGSLFLMIAGGLSATGVGAAGAPILACVPVPAVLALIIVAVVWRRS